MLRRIAAAGLLVGIGMVAGATLQGEADAQLVPPPGGIKRTVLQKVEVPDSAYDVVMVLAEIPGKMKSVGKHTHPGYELTTVIEGQMNLMVDGQPAKIVKRGESFQVAPGAIHDAGTGNAKAKLVAVYLVERGKPLASPVSKTAVSE
jgi:quercetin dioxygenase-like cupin family protein